MTKLDKKQAQLLATGLREVYAMWEREKFSHACFTFNSGICLALTYTAAFQGVKRDDKLCPYVLMQKIMSIVEPDGSKISFIAQPGDWSARTAYCLLLAEYIESEILQTARKG